MINQQIPLHPKQLELYEPLQCLLVAMGEGHSLAAKCSTRADAPRFPRGVGSGSPRGIISQYTFLTILQVA